MFMQQHMRHAWLAYRQATCYPPLLLFLHLILTVAVSLASLFFSSVLLPFCCQCALSFFLHHIHLSPPAKPHFKQWNEQKTEQKFSIPSNHMTLASNYLFGMKCLSPLLACLLIMPTDVTSSWQGKLHSSRELGFSWGPSGPAWWE